MLAYRLRHRVTFQRQENTRDPNTGARNTAWVTALLADGTSLQDVAAEVLTGPGRQKMAAGAQQETAALRVNCRYFEGLEPTWRIIWQGRVYPIIGMPEMDATAAREWRIACSGGVSDGQ